MVWNFVDVFWLRVRGVLSFKYCDMVFGMQFKFRYVQKKSSRFGCFFFVVVVFVVDGFCDMVVCLVVIVLLSKNVI